MYTYLISTIPLILIWIWIFTHEKYKNVRKEMLIMSLLTGFGFVLTSYYFWTMDWWIPETITGTIVGIENFIVGFAMGGIMAGTYDYLFDKKMYIHRSHLSLLKFLIPTMMLVLMMFIFMEHGVTSFWSATFALLILTFYIIHKRSDLVSKSIYSGFITLAVSLLSYGLIYFIDIDWANRTYMFDTLTGIRVYTFPIEEFVFWFLAGCFFSIYYEYAMKGKLK
jgi:Lycopene cyclase